MKESQLLFSKKALRAMIVPLFLEQLLVMLVGIADTLVVSYAGEAAVSGVALVNQANTIFLYLFMALASGGAVVISQYFGRKDSDTAGLCASQLLMISAVFSLVTALLVLAGNRLLLRLLFGQVEEPVMEACVTYLWISALSYPALAIYNSGAAVCRSLGKTDVTLYISVAANLINIIGNLIGVFMLHAGTAGVAWPSFAARTFSALAVTLFCFRHQNEVFYRMPWIFQWDPKHLAQIAKVAVPGAFENGTFQLVKVALSSIAALFGTSQIAANGTAQSIWSLAALAGVSMGPVFITVIGQCMGSGRIEEAQESFYRLLKITLKLSCAWNGLILILTPLFLRGYALEWQTKQLVLILVIIHNLFNALCYPFSGALSDGLRAAGDVRFTMKVSIASTLCVRLFLSWLLGIGLQMGVIGIALAMAADWMVRAVFFAWRLHSGKWKSFQIIH